MIDAQTRRQLNEWRRQMAWTTVQLVVPQAVEGTGYDPFTQDRTDIAESMLSVGGKAISQWLVLEVRVRLSGPSPAELQSYVLNTAFELGDVKVFFRKTDESAFAELANNPHAYLFHRGQAFRPFSAIHSDGVLGDDERVVFCRRHTPTERAAGY